MHQDTLLQTTRHLGRCQGAPLWRWEPNRCIEWLLSLPLRFPWEMEDQFLEQYARQVYPWGTHIEIYCAKTVWHLVLRQRRAEALGNRTIGERLDDAAGHLKISHKEQFHRIGISRRSYYLVRAGKGGKRSLALVGEYLRSIERKDSNL